MSQTLFTAKVGQDELRIEVANRMDRAFILDCNWTRSGSKAFLELPRHYQSARGAKLAAARLMGEPLEWIAVSE